MSGPADASDKAAWWLRWPALRREELAAFARHGATVVGQTERKGFLLLDVDWPFKGGTTRLNVGYSPLHPFFRPAVQASELTLVRHQNPFSKALCLLVQEAGQWNSRDTAADLIASQLPEIDRAIAARAEGDWSGAAAVEEQAPDPITAYYLDRVEEHSAIFFAEKLRLPDAAYGTATFACQARPFVADTAPFEAVLTQVRPPTGRWLAPAQDLPRRTGATELVAGRWVRLPTPLPNDPDALLALADAAISRGIGPSGPRKAEFDAIAGQRLSITGILLEEEVGYGPDRMGPGWLFVVRRNTPGRRPVTTLVAGLRVAHDLFSRLPIARALRDRSALVVGCGAIGAPVIIELAKAGFGEVSFVDHDRVEPGNTVRWPLGRAAWGLAKVAALEEFLIRNYPFTNTKPIRIQIGAATTSPADMIRNPADDLRECIAAADVVIDASASTECQEAMAHLCREAGRPLVVGYATLGVAGGVVARFPMGSPACLVCLHEHWADGSTPLPNVDADGIVVPVGCNSPTFTGGAFDLQEVSLEMVRSAIGMVAPEVYDAGDWQLAILKLRDDGRRTMPVWTADDIARHPHCSCQAAG